MMTRDQQLHAAAELLGHPDDMSDVHSAIIIVNVAKSTKHLYSKNAKRKLIAYIAALRRLAAADTSLRSIPYQQLWVPFIPAKIVNEHLAKCQQQLAAWPKKSGTKGDIERRRLAALMARHLLGGRATTTRRGKWCRLAAILFGDPNVDLFRQCCEIAKENQTL
jgi:hypothetical protein